MTSYSLRDRKSLNILAKKSASNVLLSRNLVQSHERRDCSERSGERVRGREAAPSVLIYSVLFLSDYRLEKRGYLTEPATSKSQIIVE